MAALSIQVPYPVFYDRDGQPLDNGNIYIGVANLDPVTNPLQVYYDEALTITASQPLVTSGGYVYRNGTPTQLYVNASDFSITVNDSKDLFVYNFPEATGIGTGASSVAFTGFKGQVGTVADLADADGSNWIGYTPSGSGSVARSAQDKMRDFVNVADFGAVGDGSGTLVGAAATGAVWNVWPSWINGANYGTKPGHDYGDAAYLAANPPFSPTDTLDFIGIQRALWAVQTAGGGTVNLTGTDYVVNRPIRFVMPATGEGVNLVGSHPQKCQIRPLTSLAPINSIGTNIGSGVLYFYRIGLSGCSVRNLGITTFPKNGGTPTVEFDSRVVTADWESNGTYRACVLYNNCDTVNLQDVFTSGYGEAGVAAIQQSAINLDNYVTEYQSCSVLLRGNSSAWITDSILFNSSGTSINAWGASAVCLDSSKAYVSGGQITFMRRYAVLALGTNNEFTLDDVVIYTENFGLLFYCLGLLRYRVANCFMTYGLPNETPIVLLDNQNTGSGDTLNANSTGSFIGNNVANTGGLSTLDILRVNGTYLQVTNNSFNAQADGSTTSNLVVNSLINGNYAGAGTVKCIFSENTLKFFPMSKVSVFGTKQNNIDTVGNAILVGTVYPGAVTVNAGTTSNFDVTVTGVALGDLVTGVSFILNQLTGLTVSANVTAADTVRVQLANVTAGNISISNELWTVMVQRKNCL